MQNSLLHPQSPAQNYGYPADVEFFGAQTGLLRRLEGHFPNKMAISRLLASGRLKSAGKNGALAFKTADLDALIAERRREVVSSVLSKGPEEREKIIAELAEGHATIGYRASPDHSDKFKAEKQVETMVASARQRNREGYRAGRMKMKLTSGGMFG